MPSHFKLTLGWLFAAMTLLPGIAGATCRFVAEPNRTATIALSVPATVTVPRDAVNGTVIYTSAVIPPPFRVTVSCNDNDPFGIINDLGTQPASGGSIYPIGNTGLSFRWRYERPTPDSPVPYFPSFNGPFRFIGAGSTGFVGTSHGFELVKTGPIAPNAVVPGGLVARWRFSALDALLMSLSNPIQVVAQTCQVDTSSVAVNLTPGGSLRTSTFTGVNSTSQPVSFSLELNCAGTVATMGVTLTDVRVPGNTGTNLPLTATSSATGLNVQILRNGVPIRFGPDSSQGNNTNQNMLGSVNGGRLTVPLTARYIQTIPKVTPGTANAIATATFSYR